MKRQQFTAHRPNCQNAIQHNICYISVARHSKWGIQTEDRERERERERKEGSGALTTWRVWWHIKLAIMLDPSDVIIKMAPTLERSSQLMSYA